MAAKPSERLAGVIWAFDGKVADHRRRAGIGKSHVSTSGLKAPGVVFGDVLDTEGQAVAA
jgi:hypothetical protein